MGDDGETLWLYAYQLECHCGPNWDILDLVVPMSGNTPIGLDIDGDGTPDTSWNVTDKSGFMPYSQPGPQGTGSAADPGLAYFCSLDSFGVDPPDFITSAVFDATADTVTLSNADGIFPVDERCLKPRAVNSG